MSHVDAEWKICIKQIKHGVIRIPIVRQFVSINFLRQPFLNCKESYFQISFLLLQLRRSADNVRHPQAILIALLRWSIRLLLRKRFFEIRSKNKSTRERVDSNPQHGWEIRSHCYLGTPSIIYFDRFILFFAAIHPNTTDIALLHQVLSNIMQSEGEKATLHYYSASS